MNKYGEKASITILQIDLLFENRIGSIKPLRGYLIADYRYSLYDKAIYDIEGILKDKNKILYLIGKRGFDTSNKTLLFTLFGEDEPIDIVLKYDEVKNAYYGIKHISSVSFKNYEYVKAKITIVKGIDELELIESMEKFIRNHRRYETTIKVIDKLDTPTINEYYHLYERSNEAKIYFKNIGKMNKK